VGKTGFQVICDARDIRGLRAALITDLIQTAKFLDAYPEGHCVIVLDEPLISDDRLLAEWAETTTIIQPQILNRVTFVIRRDGAPNRILGELSEIENTSIPHIVKNVRLPSVTTVARSSHTYFDILRILINQWIQRAGPVTSRWIAEQAGCTYPTVASALQRLHKYLIRSSDRRVQLRAFPAEEWNRLVANADEVRETIRFADGSGQPRSVDSLLQRVLRFQDVHINDASLPRPLDSIAIAGVPGARHYFPGLDLVGAPRLDLTIHCRSRKPDIAFMGRLDPALIPCTPGQTPRVVIHLLSQAEVFFERDSNGVLLADPVECLLDLHEMRFESQAAEFLSHLTQA
jgi:hypothetical protein